MFRDASQELERLQSELLAEEEEAFSDDPPEEDEEEYEEEYGQEEAFADYEDTRPSHGPAVYQNYSNDYGKNLRNYASGYRAYNTDTSDEDLDAYSEDVREGRSGRGGCCLGLIALLLALVILALLGIWFALERGYIG